MNHESLLKKTRGGSVLPLVMLVVVLLMTIGVGLLGLSMHSRMFAVRSAANITARSAADSAVSNAIFQMNEKLKVKPWDDSSLPAGSNVELLQCDATFDYAVSKDSGIYSAQGTGRSGKGVRAINSTLRLYSPFDFAVFAREYVELKNGSVVDWVNNQSDDWPMQIGTSSTADGAVSLKNGSIVNGDVVVGMGGDPETVIIDNGADISGEIYAMTSDPVLPSITVPDYLQLMLSGDVIDSNRTISTSGKYDKIDLGSSDVLTIDEPVELYITDNIILKNSAKIRIGGPTDTDNDASLVIYLGGNLEGKNSSEFNNLTEDATRFSIYCLDTCEDIEFKNSSDFYGAIYAPEASVLLHNSADVYGSIIAKSVEFKNSATVYYDVNLRDRSVNDEGVRFVIARWSEQ